MVLTQYFNQSFGKNSITEFASSHFSSSNSGAVVSFTTLVHRWVLHALSLANDQNGHQTHFTHYYLIAMAHIQY
jgi:hypothetical protein